MLAMKTAIIDVGGGHRGAFSAGITDKLMEENIYFDTYIGVSAGSSNMASYMAGQIGRKKDFYCEYFYHKEFASFKNFFKGERDFLDFDYLYQDLSKSGALNPLDYQAIKNNPAELIIVATDANTGKPVYFNKDDLKQDDYRVLSASSNVPIINRPIKLKGREYYDGGISDPIPLKKALDLGSDRVVIVLSRPKSQVRKPTMNRIYAKVLRKYKPRVADAIACRSYKYNETIVEARDLESKGRVFILAPENLDGIKLANTPKERIYQLYEEGYEEADKLISWLDGLEV